MDKQWYKIPSDEALKQLDATIDGLSGEEAQKRLEKYGSNELPAKKPPTLLKIIFDQLINPLIYILIAAAAVSMFIGDVKDAFFIFVVILVNTAIGAYQEWKAEKSTEALQNLLKIFVQVKRDDTKRLISANLLVPGDIVLLESGNKVPADIRLIKTTGLMTDESLLTGESVEINKRNDVIDKDVPLGDRENMVFAGSTITSGRAIGLVVETALKTEIGKISKAVTSVEKVHPPLIKRMEEFSHQISIIVLFACAVIALIEFIRGTSLLDVFFLAVALAVSAIPEGLPASLSVVLSVGMSRMSKRNVIIRKLSAVEGLGSCTMIASDKTGTLTVNKQTVKLLYLPDGSRYNITGEGYNNNGKVVPCKEKFGLSKVNEIIRSAVICNEASLYKKDDNWTYHGDAVDIALLALGYKNGMGPDKINREINTLREIPFESERKFSAKFYEEDSKVKAVVKGAVEVILQFCPDADSKRIQRQLKAFSRTGHRVIAVAEGEISSKHDHCYYEEDLKGLNFLGLIGLIDPLRPEAIEAVDTCKKAGIKVIMITGDHPETALTIGKNLSIANSGEDVIQGKELDNIDENSDEFVEIVSQKSVFARVAPLQKLHIVSALNRSGHFIAVTGDGVNDAPALKKAHISMAMGSGTDVAKDVSSMIVVDDNFASVVAGVEEGRYAYDNIRKVIYLLVSTGAAEIALFLFAVGFNMPIPLVAVQLLWLNLVTNGIQGVALAFEKGEKETMLRPPRNPKEGIFNELMVKETLISGLTMGFVAYALWVALLSGGMSEGAARNMVLLLMVLFENIHVLNCRSEYKSAFKVPLKNNMLLITGILGAQAIHIVSMNIPLMQDILGVSPIGLTEWLFTLGFALSLLVVMELFKFFRGRRIADAGLFS